MTACDNEQARISGKKVVSATLVGALAAGMVPAMALAAESGSVEGTTEGDIELLVFDPAAAFGKAEIKSAVDGRGAEIKEPSNPLSYKFIYGDDNIAFRPTSLEVDSEGGKKTIDVTSAADYKVEYFISDDAAGTSNVVKKLANELAGIKESDVTGKYLFMSIEALTEKTGYKGGKLLQAFTLSEQQIDFNNVTLFNASGEDVANKTFTFDNAAQEVGVAIDGKILDEANYDITYEALTGSELSTGLPQLAGTYIAVIKGTVGTDYAKLDKKIQFTVDKLDLSKADLSVDTTEGVAEVEATDVKLNGETIDTAIAKEIGIKFKTATDDKGAPVNEWTDGKLGTWTYTVSKLTALSSGGTQAVFDSIVDNSEKEVTFKVVTAVKPIYYGESAQNPMPATMNIDLSLEKFNFKNITTKEDATNSKLKIEVTDAEGKQVDRSKLNEAGVWTVSVEVADPTFALGGNAKTVVTCKNAIIDADANVFVKYKGNLTGSVTDTYSGADIIKDIEVVVLDNSDKPLVAGTDFTVTYTEVKTGKEVKEIINANQYLMTVESDKYEIIGANTAKVTVNPIELIYSATAVHSKDTVRLGGTVTIDNAGTPYTFLPYTGEAIVPVFEYTADDLTKVTDPDDVVWKTLPADAYNLSIEFKGEAVEEVKDAGAYKFVPTPKLGNYNFDMTDLSTTPLAMEVSKKKAFADVPAGEWFFQSVYTAYEQKYVQGIGGTNIFGSYRDITRADVACVLFNMAGGKIAAGAADYNEEYGWYTPFTDVSGKAYYSEALSWAYKAGVVNGINGASTYEPERNVTREEFGAMLANYAKVVGNFEAVDTAKTLADFPDGAAVSDWAKDSVAWAAANKYMGNGGVLNAGTPITRAEVAAVAVNYQPKSFANQQK